ncbi:alpha/beta fold hydrolase [Antarctobacter heliothermus]|uniref:Lysine decarboxylase transcriptional regulator, CadC n=1 Tax=Antarctobacter heliothermus TaxID=74033 RepID=A0A239AWL4_9RHOB|nr:alpha/beta fold hydrolase [Antarctobacter heliothermus]SNR99997.1 lysine decarboxylase transcriptional regulator, CadC [Antarctobacter heliothermus]
MILRFASCVIDFDRRTLVRRGDEVHVEPQVFDLIAFMAQTGGTVVSKDKLVEVVWKGLAVSDATISARISAARTALGDSGKEQAILRTIPRRGFAFVAQLDQDSPPAPAPAVLPSQVSYALSRDGTAIAWSAHGEGPPLVRIGHWLSHLELDTQSAIWGPLIDRLGQGRRLVRYDLRGTGLSDRDAPLTGIDDFAEDLAAVADAAGLDLFDLFAASQAAPVAIRFAARWPDRVRRLVVVGGYVEGRVHRAGHGEDLDEETMLAMIRAGWGKADSPFMQAFATLFAPDATRAQRAELVTMQLSTASPESAVSLRKLIDRFDIRADLPKVRIPALIFHAAGDAIHPISQGQKLAAHLPGAQFVRLDSRSHMLLPQDPAWATVMDGTDAFLSA